MELRRSDFGEPVVETMVQLQWPDGTRVAATIRVGKPYALPDGSCWRSPVELVGHRGRYPDIAGEDALQSLCLALGLVRTELANFRADGGEVLFADSDEPWDLDASFGTSSRTSM